MMRFRDRFDRTKRKRSSRQQRIGIALFWLLVLAYAYFIPINPNWNAESHLYTTFSMVDHHSVNIDAYHQRLGDESYTSGHYYSDKAPGLALLAVVPYAVIRAAFPSYRGEGYTTLLAHRGEGGPALGPDYTGAGYQSAADQWFAIPGSTAHVRYAITYLLIIVPSAIFAVLLWLFLSRILGSNGWALAATLTYSLGTIAYVYSTQFFSHQLAAILLFSAFLLLNSQLRGKAVGRRPILFTCLAGLLSGYAVISEYPTVLIACALALYAVSVSLRKRATFIAFAVGLVPPAILVLGYNVLAFGKPFATGYTFVHSSSYQSQIHPGLFGFANPLSYGIQLPSWDSLWQITFGSYRGIFLISPVLLLFFAGLYFMWRRTDLRPELWLCLAVVLLYFLMDASRGLNQNGWSGGWSVASRHLTPMLPFMMVPICMGLVSQRFRAVFSVLATISVAITFMAVASGDQFTFVDRNPLVNEMLPHFFHGELIASWGSLLGLTGLLSLVPLAILSAVLGGRLIRLAKSGEVRAEDSTLQAVELRAS